MTYAKDVRRLGSHDPYRKEDGSRYYLSNATSFKPCDVETDGQGNILAIPLHIRKDCFGRPERAVRGALERGQPYGPVDAFGEHKRGETRCDRCPLFDACMDIAEERLRAAPAAMHALDDWWALSKRTTGKVGTNASYVGRRGVLWRKFLSAIEEHGGWSTVNDDLIRIQLVQKRDERRRKRRERRTRAKKKKALDRKLGRARLTPEFLAAIDNEAERRAAHLKGIRHYEDAPTWLKRLPDSSCDRLANVWRGKCILERASEEPTGTAIARMLCDEGRDAGSKEATLRSRVCEDLRRRLPELEEDLGNGALWGPWSFATP